MDGLHGTGLGPALHLVQANLSQKIRFKIWAVNEEGRGKNTSSLSECCTMTGLRSCLTQNVNSTPHTSLVLLHNARAE